MASKLQQFEFKTVKRSEIKLADYNPRLIDDRNLKKLTKNIRENGLIEPVVWNKRTGFLVGGHQRLMAADKIYRSDYDVPVAVIDVDDQEERKLNVILNNPSEQGDWDLQKLEGLHMDGLSFEDMGFDKSQLTFMFGDDMEFDKPSEPTDDPQDDDEFEGDGLAEIRVDEPEDDVDETDEVEDEKDKLAAFNQKKANFRHKDQDETVIDFYVKVVFPDNETKREFFRKANIPAYEEFITFDMLKRAFEKGSD